MRKRHSPPNDWTRSTPVIELAGVMRANVRCSAGRRPSGDSCIQAAGAALAIIQHRWMLPLLRLPRHRRARIAAAPTRKRKT